MAAAWLHRDLALRALPPLAVVTTLWWSSSRAHGPEPPDVVRDFLHNGAHVVAYAALGAALWLAVTDATWRLDRCRLAVAWSAVYGVVDELHQSTVPGRVCSVADVLSDTLGAALAVVALQAWLARAPNLARWLPWLGLLAVASVTAATFCDF